LTTATYATLLIASDNRLRLRQEDASEPRDDSVLRVADSGVGGAHRPPRLPTEILASHDSTDGDETDDTDVTFA